MTNVKLELAWGAGEIAAEIGRTERQTFHLLENGALPAKKVQGRWVAEKGQLRAFFLRGSNGEAAQ